MSANLPQRQPVHVWDDMGIAGPFMWARSSTKPGQWLLYVHMDQVVPEGHVYESVSGRAADDGFGNLLLLGGMS